jgi:hypothetical protein
MSGRLKAGIAIGAVALAVPVASVLGRGAGQAEGPGQPAATSGGVGTASVHPVGAQGGVRLDPAQAKSGGSGVKLAYFETPKQTVKEGQSGLIVGPVPRRCRVINGYYFILQRHTTDVLSMGDSPAGLRKWDFYRDNESGSPVHGVRYGVVCLKGASIITGG